MQEWREAPAGVEQAGLLLQSMTTTRPTAHPAPASRNCSTAATGLLQDRVEAPIGTVEVFALGAAWARLCDCPFVLDEEPQPASSAAIARTARAGGATGNARARLTP